MNARQQLALATGLYLALTTLFTWPLVVRPGAMVLGWSGDNLYFVWLVGWFRQALAGLRSPLFAPQLNYPEGWSLAFNEPTPAMALLALPGVLLGGPVLGYNSAVVLSFVLSGLGAFFWARRLSGSAPAALVAGTIFAYAPYRLSHLNGHFNLLGTQWLPCYFLGLDALLCGRGPLRRSLLLSAVGLGLTGLSSLYYLYMALVVSAAYLVAHLALRQRQSAPGLWQRLGLLALAALPMLLLAILPTLQLAMRGALPTRTFEEVRQWSASLSDYLLPAIQHPLWGAWIERTFDRSLWVENSLYLGAIPLALAGAAWLRTNDERRTTNPESAVGGRRSAVGGWRLAVSGRPSSVVRHPSSVIRRPSAARAGRRDLAVISLAALAACILSLGVELRWLGQPVLVGGQPLALPGAILFHGLPFYAGMRVWMRYGVFVLLFVAMLAGVGLARLIERAPRRLATPLILVTLALIVLDFVPRPYAVTLAQGRTVDAWLAARPGGAVAQLPWWQLARAEHTYYSLAHGHPFVGGFYAAYPTAQWQRIRPLLETFPSPESLAVLRELGVRWLVVDSTPYPDWPAILRGIEALNLQPATVIEGQYVYDLAEG